MIVDSYLRNITSRRNEIEHCRLQNVSRCEKRRKKKVKIKTQNERKVETERNILHQIYEKAIIRTRKKQCHVSSRVIYL